MKKNVSDQTGEVDAVTHILSLKKYRELNIPPETALNIYSSAISSGQSPKEAQKTLREKLHNVVAPYLGDPEYPQAYTLLETAFQSNDPKEICRICWEILSEHASTRERLGILEDFYPRLFDLTGKPDSLFDLACGLNPLAMPWMGVSNNLNYYAYDLNEPRITLINHFFELSGFQTLGFHQDILLRPPVGKADLAFLFKEAHRMEQRQRGCTRRLIDKTNVPWFLLSLPTNSLGGRYDLVDRHRRLVRSILAGATWPVTEIIFSSEIVFCIYKGDQ